MVVFRVFNPRRWGGVGGVWTPSAGGCPWFTRCQLINTSFSTNCVPPKSRVTPKSTFCQRGLGSNVIGFIDSAKLIPKQFTLLYWRATSLRMLRERATSCRGNGMSRSLANVTLSLSAANSAENGLLNNVFLAPQTKCICQLVSGMGFWWTPSYLLMLPLKDFQKIPAKLRFFFFCKATPIYLLVLRAQEVGNEPFWNKKKSWKMWLFLFILFFLESDD